MLLKARGQLVAEVEPGIMFIVVKPNATETYSQVYSVDIPPIAENILLIAIPAKFVWLGTGAEDAPLNQDILNYCLKIVAKFMEGELAKEQIDRAVWEAIRLGWDDHAWRSVQEQQSDPYLSAYQMRGLRLLAEMLEWNPRAKVAVADNGKEYIFKYSSKGTLVIEFPWY